MLRVCVLPRSCWYLCLICVERRGSIASKRRASIGEVKTTLRRGTLVGKGGRRASFLNMVTDKPSTFISKDKQKVKKYGLSSPEISKRQLKVDDAMKKVCNNFWCGGLHNCHW